LLNAQLQIRRSAFKQVFEVFSICLGTFSDSVTTELVNLQSTAELSMPFAVLQICWISSGVYTEGEHERRTIPANSQCCKKYQQCFSAS